MRVGVWTHTHSRTPGAYHNVGRDGRDVKGEWVSSVEVGDVNGQCQADA